MPRNRYTCNYRLLGVVLLPFFPAVQKFLQSVVHMVQARFDPLPVPAQHTLSPRTDEGTHCCKRKQRQCEHDQGLDESHHMIRVPCIRPSTSEIAIADANMPNMIQNRSMLVPSQTPEVEAHLHQAQQRQCDQYGQ